MTDEALTELLNEWGTRARVAAGEERAPFPSVADFLQRSGLAGAVPFTSDEDLTRVANRLFAVFVSADAGERIAVVNAALDDSGVRPIVDDRHGCLTDSWVVDDGEHVVLASAALALRRLLARDGGVRLGVCAGSRCVDVYVDASPARRRRYCSVTCQNRTRVARYRARVAARGH